ncbi:MAG: DUF2782 domain-containing protein [Gammaproteobacteria bacterium]|jgi:hypothetical protein
MKKMLAVIGLVCTFPVMAEEPPVVEPLPDEAPPLPSGLEDEQLEPEVRIIKEQDSTIREYRMNGQLYMVKIEPARGIPYYLIDMDGDGLLESRRNQISPEMVVPSWMIYRW